MTPERAKEIMELGRQWANPGKYCTPAEDNEVRDLWLTMPGYTCWYDALLRISNRQSVIAALVKYGHTPVKSLEIALDAERGDPHAIKWIAMVTT